MWHFLHFYKLSQEIIWVLLSDMYQLKQAQEGVPRKKMFQKLDKKKEEEW